MTFVIDAFHSFDRDEHGRHMPSIIRMYALCKCGSTSTPSVQLDVSDYTQNSVRAAVERDGWKSIRCRDGVHRYRCPSCVRRETAQPGEQLVLGGVR